jgi:hypothetical protein
MKRLGAMVLAGAMLGACGSPRASAPAEGKASEPRPTRQAEPPQTEPPAPSPTPEPPVEPSAAPTSEVKQPFAHIRVDRAARVVEIDGMVPIDAHDPETPTVYLEVTVCTRDSKEHESLVMTDAKPSEVHAALLLIGLQPGTPGSWTFDGKKLTPTPPMGDGVEVTLSYRDADGREVEAPAADWVISRKTGARFGRGEDGPAWVFAGSRFVVRNGRERYDADGAGTLIGLTTFGGETIAWSEVHSHEAQVEEPEWIADASKVPAFGTPVVVRIRPRP